MVAARPQQARALEHYPSVKAMKVLLIVDVARILLAIAILIELLR